jgi:hypothetical protein
MLITLPKWLKQMKYFKQLYFSFTQQHDRYLLSNIMTHLLSLSTGIDSFSITHSMTLYIDNAKISHLMTVYIEGKKMFCSINHLLTFDAEHIKIYRLLLLFISLFLV